MRFVASRDDKVLSGEPLASPMIYAGGGRLAIRRGNCSTLAKLLALCATVASAAPAGATTYQVGPGRTYTNLQAVAGLLNPGDVVEVDGNATYPGNVVFSRPGTASSPITIRGVRVNGKRPIISGGANAVEFYTGYFPRTGADYYTFEGFEVTGATSRGIYLHSVGVTIRDCVIHDNLNGIMGADGNEANSTIEYCEFYKNGSSIYYHTIYMGQCDYAGAAGSLWNMPPFTDGVTLIRYNWFHDAAGGQTIKSRSPRTKVYYNRIEGSYTADIELIASGNIAETNPEQWVIREDGDIVGNLIVRGTSGYNGGNWCSIRLGGDGSGAGSRGRYRLVNNTIILPSIQTNWVIWPFTAIESIEFFNNVFYRTGGGGLSMFRENEANWYLGEKITGTNNWYPAGSTNLSSSPGWTNSVVGTDPAFNNTAAGDYSPAAGSPLLDAGNDSVSSPPGYNLNHTYEEWPPAYHPPGQPGVFGSPNPRPYDGQIDIGAYERGTDWVGQPSAFYTLQPCRLLDTRLPVGSYGGPAVPAAGKRVVVAVGPRCGIPATARAISLNVTAVTPSAPGYLSFSPGTSVLNFTTGQTRANNAVVILPSSGLGTLALRNSSTASVHVVIDVNGYFE